MKIRLLPLAIAAAIVPGITIAAGPTLYGKFDVSYEYVDTDESARLDYDRIGAALSAGDGTDKWELNSNTSRLGVRGSETISDNLGAIYQAEFEINVDDGDKNGQTINQRDIFVGLNGGWGTVMAGKFDTPMKKSQGKIDQFNDRVSGDISNVVVGEVRPNNLIQYSSPKVLEAVTLHVAFQPGEQDCDDDEYACQNGAADNLSMSAVYQAGPVYAALAYDNGMGGFDTVRLVGIVQLDALQLGALVQTAEQEHSDREEDAFILSAAFDLNDTHTLRFQYGMADIDGGTVTGEMGDFADVAPFNGVDYLGNEDGEITQIGVGIDHKLSKQTKLFANYIMLDQEGEIGGEDADGFDFRAKAEEDVARFQLGIVHNF